MKLLKVKEAAEYIGMSEGWVKLAIRNQELPYAKFGRCIRFRPEDLDAYVSGKIVGTTRSHEGTGVTNGVSESAENTRGVRP